jgi:glycosyltransferase involved in cell wall biosynthesis
VNSLNADYSMSVAKILITDLPIPFAGFGSWSQRIEYLLQHYPHNIFDYLICPDEGAKAFEAGTTKRLAMPVRQSRWRSRLNRHYRFAAYKNAIRQIAAKHDKLVIGIIDSLRTKNAVWAFINELGIADRCRLLYYQCGYGTYLIPREFHTFIEGINHFIYLTRNSYEFELEHNPLLPVVAHVLHNPIDHRRFYVPSDSEKDAAKTQLGFGSGIHFLWASHDRPKKGLDVVLHAWRRFYATAPQCTLHVVGVQHSTSIPGVVFHGKQPGAVMDQYVKACDIGVFSSLWTEGFSLALAEQISGGLFAIASTVGCVKEYFKAGEHGIAIDTPNLIDPWVAAFGKAVEALPVFRQQVKQRTTIPFLTYDEWCRRFCEIFMEMEQHYFGNSQ